MKHRVDLPYGIEGWTPPPARWIRAVGEVAVAVGYVLIGMGLAWILQVLHGTGITP